MLFTSPRKVPPYWTQKILPLVYDDSLSYYEVLGKLIHKINEVIGYVTDNIEELVGETVQSYFVKVTYLENEKCINFAMIDGGESENG